LKDPWILEQLDGLALRRGMSWFRDRMRNVTNEAAGVPELTEKLDVIEGHLDRMVSPAEADQQHDLAFSGISERMGAKSARRWLSWAEDRGLVVRGVTVGCVSCGAKSGERLVNCRHQSSARGAVRSFGVRSRPTRSSSHIVRARYCST
jgi:hypothetical protein